MTNTLRKVTKTVVIPERAAQAAVPYRAARAAYSSTSTELVCRLVTTTEGRSDGGYGVITDGQGGWFFDENNRPALYQVQPKPGTTTTRRVCENVTTTRSYPATPEQKAVPGVAYRPRTVVQEFGLGWNAGAHSIESITGNGSATFQVPSVVGVVVGLSSTSLGDDPGYTNIAHGIYFRRQAFQIIELGVQIGSENPFTADDTFKIERVGGRVQYFKGAELLYTSRLPSTGPVFLDASMYSGGDAVTAPALFNLGAVGGYARGSMHPMTGFTSDVLWQYARGEMAPTTGEASARRSRSNASMRPLVGLAVTGRYGQSQAMFRPMSGNALGGVLKPAYGLSAGQMMPLYGYAHGEEPKYGKSSNIMWPMTGMATDKKYGASNGRMVGMVGYSSDQPPPMLGIVGGDITYYAEVTLVTVPMVGVLTAGATTAGMSILPTQPLIGVLGGGISLASESTLVTAPMFGALRGEISAQAQVLIPLRTAIFPLVLGGDIGALSKLQQVLVMNLSSEVGGTTHYKNYPFNSAAKIGGSYYGASPDGLFLLDGDDDAGAPIDAVFGLGRMNFGNPQLKTARYCYLGADADAMELEVEAMVQGAPATYRYPSRAHDRAMREVRFTLGRGLRSTYVMPTFYNNGGGAFEVDAIRFTVDESARRI